MPFSETGEPSARVGFRVFVVRAHHLRTVFPPFFYVHFHGRRPPLVVALEIVFFPRGLSLEPPLLNTVQDKLEVGQLAVQIVASAARGEDGRRTRLKGGGVRV